MKRKTSTFHFLFLLTTEEILLSVFPTFVDATSKGDRELNKYIAEVNDKSKCNLMMEKELSLMCKNKSKEKFLKFKVMKTIGNERSVMSLKTHPAMNVWKSFIYAGEEV